MNGLFLYCGEQKRRGGKGKEVEVEEAANVEEVEEKEVEAKWRYKMYGQNKIIS